MMLGSKRDEFQLEVICGFQVDLTAMEFETSNALFSQICNYVFTICKCDD